MCNDKIGELRAGLNQLKSTFISPKVYLSDYFSDLKAQIIIACENFIKEQNDVNNEASIEAVTFKSQMINETKTFEQDCQINLQSHSLQDESFRKAISDSIRTIEANLREFESNTKNTPLLLVSQPKENEEQIFDKLTSNPSISTNDYFVFDTEESISETLLLIQRAIFSSKSALFLSKDCDFMEALSEEELSKQVTSFGVLVIIQDEFICSNELGSGPRNSYKLNNPKFAQLKKVLLKHLDNPITRIKLDLPKTDCSSETTNTKLLTVSFNSDSLRK